MAVSDWRVLESSGVLGRAAISTYRHIAFASLICLGVLHDHGRSLCHLRPLLCIRSDNGSSVRLTGRNQAASTPPSKV
jgi:hypothetical protein